MKFDYTEHKICGHFISVLINDDPTGLSDEDLEQFELWYDITHTPSSHYEVMGEEGHFAFCEVCDLMGDVYTVRQYFPAFEEVTQ